MPGVLHLQDLLGHGLDLNIVPSTSRTRNNKWGVVLLYSPDFLAPDFLAIVYSLQKKEAKEQGHTIEQLPHESRGRR